MNGDYLSDITEIATLAFSTVATSDEEEVLNGSRLYGIDNLRSNGKNGVLTESGGEKSLGLVLVESVQLKSLLDYLAVVVTRNVGNSRPADRPTSVNSLP